MNTLTVSQFFQHWWSPPCWAKKDAETLIASIREDYYPGWDASTGTHLILADGRVRWTGRFRSIAQHSMNGLDVCGSFSWVDPADGIKITHNSCQGKRQDTRT
jgi:hypothetical protein